MIPLNNSIKNIDHKNYTIRTADEKDIPLILEFIKKTALYEKMQNDVTATEERLRYSLFERKIATVIIGKYCNLPMSYAIFFYNFSSFDGKLGIYLEDIFVDQEFRGMGFAKKLISYIAKIAVNNDYSRIEWVCLNWNEQAIISYKKIGAIPQEQWLRFKLSDKNLIDMANKD